jgi:hypothetical protein
MDYVRAQDVSLVAYISGYRLSSLVDAREAGVFIRLKTSLLHRLPLESWPSWVGNRVNGDHQTTREEMLYVSSM